MRHLIVTCLHDACMVPAGVIGGFHGGQPKRKTEIYPHPVEESAGEAMRLVEGAFSA